MDLAALVGALRSYWVAVLVGLLLTAVAAYSVPRQVGSEYVVEGSVLFLSPSTVQDLEGEDVNVNPWARFGGAEAGASSAIATVLRSKSTEEILLQPEDVVDYAIDINQANGAILDITIIAESEARALDTYDLTLELLIGELETRQAESGADPVSWIRTDELTHPGSAEELTASKTRALVAVVLLGIIASVGLALALQTVFGSRGESTEAQPFAVAVRPADRPPRDIEPMGRSQSP